MPTWVWILIVIAVVIVVALIAMAARQRRTASLRQRFGPEYDRAVETKENRRAAEAELREREKQHALIDIKPLPEGTRMRFAQEWQEVQERFVDQPSGAVEAADALVYRVMDARGYPMGDFDTQADLVSVDHPEVVENYRFAHGIHERARTQAQRTSTEGRTSTEDGTSTEDLREALVRYRSLFEELLRADDAQADVTAGRRGPGGITGQTSAGGSGETSADGSVPDRHLDDDRQVSDRQVSGGPVSDRPVDDRPVDGRPVTDTAGSPDPSGRGDADAR